MIEIPINIRREMQEYLCLYQDNRLSGDELERAAKEYKTMDISTSEYVSLFRQYKPRR